MKLSEVITDRTRFDVHKRDLVAEVSEDLTLLEEYNGPIPKRKLTQYIILMYDPESPMRREVAHYMQRKNVCAETVEFGKEGGRWNKDIEAMLLGKDPKVNKLISAFISSLAIPEYTELIVLLEIQRIKAFEAFSGEVSDNTHKTMAAVTESISRITKSLFGSGEDDEIKAARRALYEQSNIDKPPRPEDISDLIAESGLPDDFSPYGEKFEVEPPRFIDDEEPKH